MARSLNDLDTRIQILGLQPNDGPEAGEEVFGVVYECWAGVDNVRMSDREQAKANNTLEDLNIYIRDPRSDFKPDNKQAVKILDTQYEGKVYNVKSVQPNLSDRQFIDIVIGLTS